MPLASLTSCVSAVSSATKVVLQQLVCPCGTRSGHQPYCGLVKKHLQNTKQQIQNGIQVSSTGTFLSTHTTSDTHTHEKHSNISVFIWNVNNAVCVLHPSKCTKCSHTLVKAVVIKDTLDAGIFSKFFSNTINMKNTDMSATY